MLPDLKTLGLSFLVAIGTLIVMALTGPVLFASGAIIFPSIVAWVAGSVFVFARRPRHLWLQVAAIGVLVATVLDLYFSVLRPRLFPPPPGYMQGGPNVLPPPGYVPPPPPREVTAEG